MGRYLLPAVCVCGLVLGLTIIFVPTRPYSSSAALANAPIIPTSTSSFTTYYYLSTFRRRRRRLDNKPAAVAGVSATRARGKQKDSTGWENIVNWSPEIAEEISKFNATNGEKETDENNDDEFKTNSKKGNSKKKSERGDNKAKGNSLSEAAAAAVKLGSVNTFLFAGGAGILGCMAVFAILHWRKRKQRTKRHLSSMIGDDDDNEDEEDDYRDHDREIQYCDEEEGTKHLLEMVGGEDNEHRRN